MGLIEFADSDGVRWRAWHVETPPARAHLMDPQYRNGWLVFEREDGTDRRRLNRVPDDWPSCVGLLCQSWPHALRLRGHSRPGRDRSRTRDRRPASVARLRL